MLFFANNQDGARCCADYPFSAAANAEVFPSGVSVSRDYNEVNVSIFCRFDDLVGRNTDPYRSSGVFDAVHLSRRG